MSKDRVPWPAQREAEGQRADAVAGAARSGTCRCRRRPHLSRSRNTRMAVLYTLMASSEPSGALQFGEVGRTGSLGQRPWDSVHVCVCACVPTGVGRATRAEARGCPRHARSVRRARRARRAHLAWYTLASLPVDTQPLISQNTPRLSILNSTMRVRGSSTCSTAGGRVQRGRGASAVTGGHGLGRRSRSGGRSSQPWGAAAMACWGRGWLLVSAAKAAVHLPA